MHMFCIDEYRSFVAATIQSTICQAWCRPCTYEVIYNLWTIFIVWGSFRLTQWFLTICVILFTCIITVISIVKLIILTMSICIQTDFPPSQSAGLQDKTRPSSTKVHSPLVPPWLFTPPWPLILLQPLVPLWPLILLRPLVPLWPLTLPWNLVYSWPLHLWPCLRPRLHPVQLISSLGLNPAAVTGAPLTKPMSLRPTAHATPTVFPPPLKTWVIQLLCWQQVHACSLLGFQDNIQVSP